MKKPADCLIDRASCLGCPAHGVLPNFLMLDTYPGEGARQEMRADMQCFEDRYGESAECPRIGGLAEEAARIVHRSRGFFAEAMQGEIGDNEPDLLQLVLNEFLPQFLGFSFTNSNSRFGVQVDRNTIKVAVLSREVHLHTDLFVQSFNTQLAQFLAAKNAELRKNRRKQIHLVLPELSLV